jgi:hypothetical protein
LKPTSKARGKATKQSAREPIAPSAVRLEAGRGSKDRGAGPGGHYWHIYCNDVRAGHVYINVIDQPPTGTHASLQIHINAAQQGRGIGSTAYRLAAEASSHNTIYAHMRKSNTPSRRAAEKAGFTVVEDPAISQLLMMWRRDP